MLYHEASHLSEAGITPKYVGCELRPRLCTVIVTRRQALAQHVDAFWRQYQIYMIIHRQFPIERKKPSIFWPYLYFRTINSKADKWFFRVGHLPDNSIMTGFSN